MKDLSPAARDLVDAHRSDRTLTSADRRRIKHDVMMRVAALGAATTVATHATAKAAGLSLASKVAVLALSVTAVTGVVSISVRASRARTAAPRPAEGSRQGSMVAVPATVPGAASAESRAVAAVPAAVAARTTPATRRIAVAAPAAHLDGRPAVTAVVAAVPAGSAAIDSARRDPAKSVVVPADPEPELRVLRQARDDLRAGRPASAYRRLDDFDRQPGAGMLAEERNALSAIALCQWQPGGQARARAAEFLRTSPESPLAIRVRSACAQTSQSSP